MKDEIKFEYEKINAKINHYDDMRYTTKGWFFTAWIAIISISLGSTLYYLIPVGTIIILFFWFLEYRLAYFQRICFARAEILEVAYNKFSDSENFKVLDKAINKKFKFIGDYHFFTPAINYHFNKSFHNEKAKKTAIWGKNIVFTYAPIMILNILFTSIPFWYYQDFLDQYIEGSFYYIFASLISLCIILYIYVEKQRKDYGFNPEEDGFLIEVFQ